MTTLSNERKVGVVSRKTQEEHFKNNQSWNTSVPRINEEYITQVSEEIEGRFNKELSQEFSRTESLILGALSNLGKFLLNPQIRTLSGTVPGTSRNTDVENQEPNGDRSQDDPHPEVESSVYRLAIQFIQTHKRPFTLPLFIVYLSRFVLTKLIYKA